MTHATIEVNQVIIQDDINKHLQGYFLRLLIDGGYNVYSREGIYIAHFIYLNDIIDFLRAKGEDSTYIENVLTREVCK